MLCLLDGIADGVLEDEAYITIPSSKLKNLVQYTTPSPRRIDYRGDTIRGGGIYEICNYRQEQRILLDEESCGVEVLCTDIVQNGLFSVIKIVEDVNPNHLDRTFTKSVERMNTEEGLTMLLHKAIDDDMVKYEREMNWKSDSSIMDDTNLLYIDMKLEEYGIFVNDPDVDKIREKMQNDVKRCFTLD
jgi:hypothetical protein